MELEGRHRAARPPQSGFEPTADAGSRGGKHLQTTIWHLGFNGTDLDLDSRELF